MGKTYVESTFRSLGKSAGDDFERVYWPKSCLLEVDSHVFVVLLPSQSYSNYKARWPTTRDKIDLKMDPNILKRICLRNVPKSLMTCQKFRTCEENWNKIPETVFFAPTPSKRQKTWCQETLLAKIEIPFSALAQMTRLLTLRLLIFYGLTPSRFLFSPSKNKRLKHGGQTTHFEHFW